MVPGLLLTWRSAQAATVLAWSVFRFGTALENARYNVTSRADAEDAEQSKPWSASDGTLAGNRRLQISTEALLNSPRIHTHYSFNLNRATMKRQGKGEMWLSFEDRFPRMRWRGAAHSPRFGNGEITVVVDPEQKQMHTLFTLDQLHRDQCLTYEFPSLDCTGKDSHCERAEVQRRLKKMRDRRDQVRAALEDTGDGERPRSLSVQWSAKLRLEFKLSDDGKTVQSVMLHHGSHIRKMVQFHHGLDTLTHMSTDDVFGPPAKDCRLSTEVKNPLARLEPHRKSSALKDLLLVLADQATTGERYSHVFMALCAIIVPGDVAVLIEDPEPPDLGTLDSLAFEYTSAVVTKGHWHQSGGSIWLDMKNRVFRLRGEANETKVGPLKMDLIANGGHKAKVYANVNLTVQGSQQCVAYDYPKLNEHVTDELTVIAKKKLQFYAISDLNGEDCGIFVSQLARGRWIHIWVDLEAENQNAILRSEIHKAGEIIRSTDILRWLAAEDVPTSVRPNPRWGCKPAGGYGQLAHLGLHEIHKRSIELQDALFSLQNLSPSFTVLEVLGLTGDVAIMVEEPESPHLWELEQVSFAFSSYAPPVNEKPSQYPNYPVRTSGTFAADLRHGHLRMTAQDKNTSISLAFENNVLAVRVKEVDKEGPAICATLKLPPPDGRGFPEVDSQPEAAIFDGVEPVHDEVCNRFTFIGPSNHPERVELWYSMETDSVCRLSLVPAEKHGSSDWAGIDVKAWENAYHPADIFQQADENHGFFAEEWGCETTAQAILDISEQPLDGNSMRSASVLSKLATAAGAIGIMDQKVAKTLSHLVVRLPSEGGVNPPEMFDSDLETFSFGYTSTSPTQARGGPRHTGSGHVYVNLPSRWLFMQSEASHVSPGIPKVSTRVLFRGDRGRMYVQTKLDDGYQECWAVNTMEVVPAERRGFNPFTRARPQTGQYSVPGREGHSAKKYVLHTDTRKRVSFFADQNELIAINFDDLYRDVSAGILVNGWNTLPVDDILFEPDEWGCPENVQNDERNGELEAWELLRVFFPMDMDMDTDVPKAVPRRVRSLG